MSAPSFSGLWNSGRRPAIVDDHRHVALMRRLGDGRQVLHLEGQRARALDEDGLGLVGDQPGNAGADAGIVELCRDAEAAQPLGGKDPGRLVGRIRDQHLFTGRDRREQRSRHRRQPGGQITVPSAPSSSLTRSREGRGGRVVVAAVADRRLVVLELVERLEQYRGSRGKPAY